MTIAQTTPLKTKVEPGIWKRTTLDGIRYEFSYRDSDGRQRWETAERLHEARDRKAALRTKVRSGERVAPSKVTLGEYAARWLEAGLAADGTKLRPTTHSLYRTHFTNHIKPKLGHRRLGDLRQGDVARLVGALERATPPRRSEDAPSRLARTPSARSSACCR